jgi:hypothetical protein
MDWCGIFNGGTFRKFINLEAIKLMRIEGKWSDEAEPAFAMPHA